MLQIQNAATFLQRNYSLAGPLQLGGGPPDLYLSTFGRLVSRGGFSWQQVSPRYCVHVIQSGRGLLEMKDGSFELKPGDVFCLFPSHHARYSEHPRHPWRYSWFSLEGSGTERAMALTGLNPRTPCRDGPFDSAMEPIFREIERAYQTDPIRPVFPIIAAWQLVQILALERLPAWKPEAIDLAESTRFLLDHEYRSPLSLKEVAARLKVSRFTVFRHFGAKFRQSPKQYLNRLRLDQAQRLLADSRSSIKEIATACGFQSAHYFSRAFRQRFGIPPKQWRKTRKVRRIAIAPHPNRYPRVIKL